MSNNIGFIKKLLGFFAILGIFVGGSSALAAPTDRERFNLMTDIHNQASPAAGSVGQECSSYITSLGGNLSNTFRVASMNNYAIMHFPRGGTYRSTITGEPSFGGIIYGSEGNCLYAKANVNITATGTECISQPIGSPVPANSWPVSFCEEITWGIPEGRSYQLQRKEAEPTYQCGPAHGTSTSTTPTGSSNLCTVGNASSVTLNSGSWNWTCGTGANPAVCSATQIVNPVCGSAHGTPTSTTPTTNLCSVGTVTPGVSLSGNQYTWGCLSSGITATCTAPQVVNGVCGSASGTPTSTTPTTNLCTVGGASPAVPILFEGQYTWSCVTGSGTNDQCSADQIVEHAVCGTAHGTPTLSQPESSHLCSVGVPALFAGPTGGQYTWSCVTAGNGNNASCFADHTTPNACVAYDPIVHAALDIQIPTDNMKAVVFSSGANAIDKINGITTVTGASYTWTGVLNPTLSLAVTINSLTHNNGTSQFVQYADVERNAAGQATDDTPKFFGCLPSDWVNEQNIKFENIAKSLSQGEKANVTITLPNGQTQVLEINERDKDTWVIPWDREEFGFGVQCNICITEDCVKTCPANFAYNEETGTCQGPIDTEKDPEVIPGNYYIMRWNSVWYGSNGTRLYKQGLDKNLLNAMLLDSNFYFILNNLSDKHPGKANAIEWAFPVNGPTDPLINPIFHYWQVNMLAGDQRRHSPQNKNGIWIRKSQPSQPNATTPFEMTDSNNLLITKGLVLSVDYVHTGSTKTVYAGVWADKALRLVKTPAGTTTGEVIAQSKGPYTYHNSNKPHEEPKGGPYNWSDIPGRFISNRAWYLSEQFTLEYIYNNKSLVNADNNWFVGLMGLGLKGEIIPHRMDKVSPYRKSDNWTYFNETATTAEGDPDTLADNEKAVSNYGNAEISTQRTYHLIPVTLSAGDTLTIQGKTDGYAESESALGMTIYDNTPAQLQALGSQKDSYLSGDAELGLNILFSTANLDRILISPANGISMDICPDEGFWPIKKPDGSTVCSFTEVMDVPMVCVDPNLAILGDIAVDFTQRVGSHPYTDSSLFYHAPDNSASFNMSVTNNGTGDLANVIIENTLPTGFTCSSVVGNAGITCANIGSLTLTLLAGQSLNYTIHGTLTSQTSTTSQTVVKYGGFSIDNTLNQIPEQSIPGYKNIKLDATVTAPGQTVTINKYFGGANYLIDRGDGSALQENSSSLTHTYTTPGTYQIELQIAGDRWTFENQSNPLVPKSGTTVSDIKIVAMPSLKDAFGPVNSSNGGNYYFLNFNNNGALTSLPAGSFDTSNITSVSNTFFQSFNNNGALTSLPAGSFNTRNITSAGHSFFFNFNNNGTLTSLPEGSFDTSNITSINYGFFASFNSSGALTSLPAGSFNTSNISGSAYTNFFQFFNQNGAITSLPAGSFNLEKITSVGNSFFGLFNQNGALTSLPTNSFNTSNITSVGSNFFDRFNHNGAITSLPAGSFNTSNITTIGDSFFYNFNNNGTLTSLPAGSFNTSNITTIGDSFFNNFNYNGALTSLPAGSFNTSNITTIGDSFFYNFNNNGTLTSLPAGSFNISNISGIVGNNFFDGFNNNGAITSLPENSFKTNNITSVGNGFFYNFNNNGTLTSLPEDSFNISNISGSVGSNFFGYFNYNGSLTSLPAGSFNTSKITSVGGGFFQFFNSYGAITSLPTSSFNTSNISGSVGSNFFYQFNRDGAITSLPAGSFNTSKITSVGTRFFNAFNLNGAITSLPYGSFNLNNITSLSTFFISQFNTNGALSKVNPGEGIPIYNPTTANITFAYRNASGNNINLSIASGNSFTDYKMDEDPMTIKLEATITAPGQTVTLNKYFNVANYTIGWGDGSPAELMTGTLTHTYASSGTYQITLRNPGSRWNFGINAGPLVPKAGTTATNIRVTAMPSLKDGFGTNNVFHSFNRDGAITSLPEGSFNISHMTTAGSNFFYIFNSNGRLTSLPEGSFDTSNMTNLNGAFNAFNSQGALTSLPEGSFRLDNISGSVSSFFSNFNYNGRLTSLPEGSFRTDNITSASNGFFHQFNRGGHLTSLPAGSFNTSNMTSVGDNFFYRFNRNGQIASLPYGSFDTSNITSVGAGFFTNFNNGGLIPRVPSGEGIPIYNPTNANVVFYYRSGANYTSTVIPGNSFTDYKMDENPTNIVLSATVTAPGQTVTLNKYFNVGDYTIERGDGTTGTISTSLTKTYTGAGTYEITLKLPEGQKRWLFQNPSQGLVPRAGTTATNIRITSMPSLKDAFGPTGSHAGDYFFASFNMNGALSALATGSFDTSHLTSVGESFFNAFNYGGAFLTSLPEGSFRLNNISTVGNYFFIVFNIFGSLQSLPEGSFKRGNITDAKNGFFHNFNQMGRLESLPEGSFDTSSITTVGNNFFNGFNRQGRGSLALPTGSFITNNITGTVGSHFFAQFNSAGTLTTLPTGSFQIPNITSNGIEFFHAFDYLNSITCRPIGAFVGPRESNINFEYLPTDYCETVASCFDFDNGTITRYHYLDDPVSYNYCGTSVVIPKMIGGVEVTTIGEKAFSKIPVDKSVFLDDIFGEEETGYNIDQLFFDNQGGLDFIVVPNTVTSIQDMAFTAAGNGSLEWDEEDQDYTLYTPNPISIVLPSTLTHVGDLSFAAAGMRGEVDLSDAISLGTGSFALNHLTNVILSDTLTEIPDIAFAKNQLSSININNVSSIGAMAFGENQLTNAQIENVGYIGPMAFALNQISNLKLDNIGSIDEIAFAMNALSHLRLQSIDTIDPSAFAYNPTTRLSTNLTGDMFLMFYISEDDDPFAVFTKDEGDSGTWRLHNTENGISLPHNEWEWIKDGEYSLYDPTSIVLEVEVTEPGQFITINKYFNVDDYIVNRGDETSEINYGGVSHYYDTPGIYEIELKLPEGNDRWRFSNYVYGPLVSLYATTVSNVKIISMPSLEDGFGESANNPGDYFFYFFNAEGAITEFPNNSFDTSYIHGNVGEEFFGYFNYLGQLTQLPNNSFDISNITGTAGGFFGAFNYAGALTSLPEGSFDTSNITSTERGFFYYFNGEALGLESLPTNSFDTSNITYAGDYFFEGFNMIGSLTSLPEGSFNVDNIASTADSNFNAFNTDGALTKVEAGLGIKIKNLNSRSQNFEYRDENGNQSDTIESGEYFDGYAMDEGASLDADPMDIVLQVEVTEPGQYITLNKYFANSDYLISRGTPNDDQNMISNSLTYQYDTPGTYNITLHNSGDRWKFNPLSEEEEPVPLVPQDGTTVHDVKVIAMPSLADGFGENQTHPGDFFFFVFNYGGALTSLPEGSFDTSYITDAGFGSFYAFNYMGSLTSLPVGSFNISNITTAGAYFFALFNGEGNISTLPTGSFNTENITSVDNQDDAFLYYFNAGGALTKSAPGDGIIIKNSSTGDVLFFYDNQYEIITPGNSFDGYMREGGAPIDYSALNIVLEVEVTEPGQQITLNKYFTNNDYLVSRGTPNDDQNMISNSLTYQYDTPGTYNITLHNPGDRWRFGNTGDPKPLVPQDGTTVHDVKIITMPSLADGFGNNPTQPGDYFFYVFNLQGAITSLPAGSLDTSNIIYAGENFFVGFNYFGALAYLPVNSFNTENIISAGSNFFALFNGNGALIRSVPGEGVIIKNSSSSIVQFHFNGNNAEDVMPGNSFDGYMVEGGTPADYSALNIVLQVEVTEPNQTLTLNKYFNVSNYLVDRGDTSTGNINTSLQHTYTTPGTYNITLHNPGSRWTFAPIGGEVKPLVPQDGTTVEHVKILTMPSLAEGFGTSASQPGHHFFAGFNAMGAITSFPADSFDTSSIISVGDSFFTYFNIAGALASLPSGSFNTDNITSVGESFFAGFNYFGLLSYLPAGSFNTENITSVGNGFFYFFNAGGALIRSASGEGVMIKNSSSSPVQFHFNGGDTIVNPGESFDGYMIEGGSPIDYSALNIVLQVEVTEPNQTLTLNKYFNVSNYLVDRGDTSTGIISTGLQHNYTTPGTYNIILHNPGSRWLFDSTLNPLVPLSGTTVHDVKIIAMPSLAEGFGTNASSPGNYFFSYFNMEGALTSLATGSFETSNITHVGHSFFNLFNQGGLLDSLPAGSFDTSNIISNEGYFFNNFNSQGVLTSLPEGSFDISNITSAGNGFFSAFNILGALTSLPEGSFDTSNITTVGSQFFNNFNHNGALTSLPANSFNTSNITSAGDYFFMRFNQSGSLTSLPAGSFNTNNITSAGSNFFLQFNTNGALAKSTPGEGVIIKNSSSSTVQFHASGSTADNIAPGNSFDGYMMDGGTPIDYSTLNIVLQVEVTQPNQTITLNKYFSTNDYLIDRGDTSTGIINTNLQHTYTTTGIYDITLHNPGSRWTFAPIAGDPKPLVPLSGTTVHDVKIITMPSLAEGFGISADNPGNYFFALFNYNGAITSLPLGSFDTSTISSAGIGFFYGFNHSGLLSYLPANSFNTENITSAGNYFFYQFNTQGTLIKSAPGGGVTIKNTSLSPVTFHHYFNNSEIINPGESFDGYMFDGGTPIDYSHLNIILEVEVTESGQTLALNKYFNVNDYVVDRGDTNTGIISTGLQHNYTTPGTYHITLHNPGSRWGFLPFSETPQPLVPLSGTTVHDVKVISMPSLADGFGTSANLPGFYFFAQFNANGALTALPEGSFDTSNITSVGLGFFYGFNQSGALTELPEGSFDINNILGDGGYFFASFNMMGSLTALPEGSFNTNNIASAGEGFFAQFNMYGPLTTLPEGSFNTSNINNAGNSFFYGFNLSGALTSLPAGSFNTDNITSAGQNFFNGFNTLGALTRSAPGKGITIKNASSFTVTFHYKENGVNQSINRSPGSSFDGYRIDDRQTEQRYLDILARPTTVYPDASQWLRADCFNITSGGILSIDRDTGCWLDEEYVNGLFNEEGSKITFIIPETVNDIPVSDISSFLDDLSGLHFTTLAIPGSVKEVSRPGYTTIDELILGEGVETITSEYGYGATVVSLGGKGFPSSLQSIGAGAFYALGPISGTTTVYIPGHVTVEPDAIKIADTYDDGASGTDMMIEKIVFGSGHTVIDTGSINASYSGPRHLYPKTLYLPSTVTHIGASNFQELGLTGIQFAPGSNLSTIGNDTFSNNSISTLKLPNSITSLGDGVFYYNNLTTLNLPNSITSLGDGVFSNNNLSTLKLPNSITSLGDWAFSYNNLTTLNLSNSITSLGDWVFSNNNLTTLNLSNSITSLGDGVFYNNNLTNITLPASLQTIGTHAFHSNGVNNSSIRIQGFEPDGTNQNWYLGGTYGTTWIRDI